MLTKIKTSEEIFTVALAFAPIGQEMTISDIHADEKLKKHLADLGLTVGGKVTPVSVRGGSMIFRVLESRIALNSALAMRITVC